MTTSQTGRSPVASLSEDEIKTVRAVLDRANKLDEHSRFVYVGLEEPDKAEVLAYQGGTRPRPDRIVRVLLLNMVSGLSQDFLVSVEHSSIVSEKVIDGSAGQIPVAVEEFELVGDIVAADQRWQAALAKRGIDPSTLVYNPLSAGCFDIPGEQGRRLLRVMALHMDHPSDNPWAHPVDGLSAYVDTITRQVVAVNDVKHLPVPVEPGNFDDPNEVGSVLEGLKPIQITQPEGPSFHFDDETLTWGNWSIDVGFDPREGIVLHNIGFRDKGRYRPILYRASVAEMVVPYGDPSPARFWQNYFDTGEYLFGRFSNSLVLGCDCLGEIHYLDAVLADEKGNPHTITNAICVHEEDWGTLWKHSDLYTGSSEVRRNRRLVVSFFTTIGNYDYGFYWYFYLDGTIELEAKLTGIVFTSSYQEGDQFATQLTPQLGAPVHQHLFSARLDVMVDGLHNAVDEVDAVAVPVSDENPWGNAFTKKTTRLKRESEAGRRANTDAARSWHISSVDTTNRIGAHPTYVLLPQAAPTLLADPGSSIAKRAAFTTKHLWVTRYDKSERYPAGDLVNQHPGGAGIPEFIVQDRDINGQDIVLWHTFGPTHFPRVEDWPIMPVDHAGFALKPFGFFDRNPALNVPAPMEASCEHHAHHDHGGGEHPGHVHSESNHTGHEH